MRKYFKKTVALLLTLLLSISSFSVTPMFAFADDLAPKNVDIQYISEKMHYVDVASGSEITLDSFIGKDADGNDLKDKNIAKTAKMTYQAYTKETDKATNVTSVTESDFGVFTDGKLGNSKEGTSNPQLFGPNLEAKTCKNCGSGYYCWETQHKYAYDIVIELKNIADIKAVVLGSSYNCPIGDHDIFAANNKDDLFKGTPIASYQMDTDKWIMNRDDNHKATSLGINCWKANKDAGLTAKFIGVRIWIGNAMPKDSSSSAKYYFDRLRTNEVAVFGDEIATFAPASIDKYDIAEFTELQDFCIKGNAYKFKVTPHGGAKITSVKYGGTALTDNEGVYTIEDTNAEPKDIVITTDKDKLSPKNGIWNGLDLSKKSAAYGKTMGKNSSIQFFETAFFYTGHTKTKLLYPIDRIINVQSYDLKETYFEGEDYNIIDGEFVLTKDTRIPLFTDLNNPNLPLHPDRSAYNANWSREMWHYQICVTYSHSKTWGKNALYETGADSKVSKLTTFYNKITSGETVNIAFIGDSITAGHDASGMDAYTYNRDSFAPNDVPQRETLEKFCQFYGGYYTMDEVIKTWGSKIWVEQVTDELKTFYNNPNITSVNRGGSGRCINWAVENADFLLGTANKSAYATPTPDLVVVAFGTNDMSNGYTKTSMDTQSRALIKKIRAINPDASILFVSAFTSNKPNITILHDYEDLYKGYETEFSNLAVAPVNAMFESLRTVKDRLDFTSAAYDHPNDFGVTVYANTILSALGYKEKSNCTHNDTTIVGKKDAKCSADGYTGDEVCNICGKVITKGTVVKVAHKSTIKTTKATYFADGKKETKCSVCGKTLKTETIKKLTLKKPTVKVTAKKKALSIKVGKVTGQTGFQIKYRLKGKKWVTKTFTTKKAATKTIKKLKAKKYYQVQVRAMVKSGSKKAYSSWTKVKTVKTKK